MDPNILTNLASLPFKFVVDQSRLKKYNDNRIPGRILYVKIMNFNTVQSTPFYLPLIQHLGQFNSGETKKNPNLLVAEFIIFNQHSMLGHHGIFLSY